MSSEVVFITGSARSGTTILGELLDTHPDLANWYEPYFIWNWPIAARANDERTEADATEKAVRFIRHEFDLYRRRSNARFVVDKSPENVFAIPFLRRIYPDAFWIHIIRDGRDVAASMHKEAEQRRKIVVERSVARLAPVVLEALSLQPFWRNKLQLIWFEMLRHRSLNPLNYLNKAKFSGKPAYGVRFPGWQETHETCTLLEFSTHQWLRSVQQAKQDLASIPKNRAIELRFEDLIVDPYPALDRIYALLDIEPRNLVVLRDKMLTPNSGRWRENWSADERRDVGNIIGDMLIELGYEHDHDWYALSHAEQ